MTYHAPPPESLTPERDQRLLHREAQAAKRERFVEGVAGPRIYSRLEMVDELRRLARVTGSTTTYRMLLQAADELERYDREVFAGRMTGQ
jgi:hypothetical protein